MAGFEIQKYSLTKETAAADSAREIFQALEKSATAEEAQSRMDALTAQWNKDFLEAGFDVEKNQKLPHYNEEKVREFEKRLDALIEEIYEKLELSTKHTQTLWQNMKKLDTRVETVQKMTPIFTLHLATPQPIELRIEYFDTFHPQTKPGEKYDIRELGIAGPITQAARLNLRATMQLDHPQSPEHEGIQKIARYLETTYFKEHSDILKAFEIQDIRHLTPRQAVQLASYIPIERIKYSHQQAQDSKDFYGNSEAQMNDSVPIDKLFEWDNDESGNGVCRNYAAVAVGVLEALKILQDQNTSLLHNVYALNIGIETNVLFGKEYIPGFVMNHAWNGYITISRGPENTYVAEGVVLDSTWADQDSLAADPARMGNNEVKIDYTRERFLTMVHEFESSGLLPAEQYLPQLFEHYQNTPPLNWQNISKQNQETELLFPKRLFIGYKILDVLNQMTKIPPHMKNTVNGFFSQFLQDIEIYEKSFSRITEIASYNALASKILYPLTRYLLVYIDVAEKFHIPVEPSIQQFITRLPLNDYFIFDLNDNVIYLADRMGDMNTLKKQAQLLRRRIQGSNEQTHEHIFQFLSPAGQQIFLEIFPSLDPQQNDENKNTKNRLKRHYHCTIDFYDSSPEKHAKFLADLENILKELSFSSKSLRLKIQKGTEGSSSIDDVNLGIDMNREQIRSQLLAYDTYQKKWAQLEQICPCDIKFSYYKKLSSEDFEKFLTNAFEYISRAPESLLRFKELTFGTVDSTEDYVHPKINIRRFLDHEFHIIDRLLARHNPAKFETLYGQIDIEKKFHDLLDVYPFLKDIRINGAIDKLDSFYEPLRQKLDIIASDPKYQTAHREKFGIIITESDMASLQSSHVTQDGTINLHTAHSYAQAADELMKQLDRYIKFQDDIASIRDILPGSWKISSQSDTVLKQDDNFIKKAKKVFQGRDLHFLEGFRAGKIDIAEGAMTIACRNISGTIEHQIRINFTKKNPDQIFNELKSYFEILRRIGDKATYLRDTYNVQIISYESYLHNFVYDGLLRVEKVLRNGKYNGFTVQIDQSLTTKDYSPLGENCFVNERKKEIIVR